MLGNAGSFGRARALTVLAEEELGKATGVYHRFSQRWSDRSVEPAELPTLSVRDHLAKFRAAFEFGRELETFWGDDYPEPPDNWDQWHAEQEAEAEAEARAANAEKELGFYVDLIDGVVRSPAGFGERRVAGPLRRAARVIEMMLIQDHSRMKFNTPDNCDETGELQWRVMPTSHPEEYEDFVASIAWAHAAPDAPSAEPVADVVADDPAP